MSLYEDRLGKDWESLDENEAIDRAYALGVATTLGEYHPEELDAIREEMDTAYSKSVVELAFEEGKNEGRAIDVSDDNGDQKVWSELVEGETVTVDPEDGSIGGLTGLPEAVDKMELLDSQEIDSTEAVDLPDFLEK